MPYNSSRVIEMEVTSPLEAMLARIGGISEITSTSGNGWGRITLEMDRHADIDAARFEASTIVRQAWPAMPEGLSYPVIELSRPDDKEARPFISYTVNAAVTPILIQRFAENIIKPRLSGIDGIYRIDITGATPLEWLLEYDSRQLSAVGVSVDDIRRAISRHFSREFLGLVKENGSGDRIRLTLANDAGSKGESYAFDPSLIAVATKSGSLISLDRLLRVTRREEAPSAYYRINGLNSVYLSIHSEESANQLELAARIKEEMAGIGEVMPPGYEMHISYDATRFIREELSKIYLRTAMTIVILLVFVLMMTRSWRYLVLIVSSLVINVCIAFIFYWMLGLEMQLYSLAGVTISLSLIIDNTIVMSDHIRRRHNRDAFLPILAATLTTLGALSVIFFLDDEIRLNLQDFAAVVIVNLAVSLAVALFFIPALQETLIPWRRRIGRQTLSPKKNTIRPVLSTGIRRLMGRLPVYGGRLYLWQMGVFNRWRKSFCFLLVLGFGLPVFMLPDKIDMKASETYTHADSVWIGRYNRYIGSVTYKEKIRPVVDKALGGTLRLFVEKVYEGSYFTRREELVLTVTASLPNGVTLPQMNNLIGRMEAYLSTFSGSIRQFQTNIFNARQARIDIFFTKESGRSGFPYTLKDRIIGRALELGGGSWSVYGLPDQGFNNDVRESAGNYRIKLLGYNYDELYSWAEAMRDSLLTYRRIKEVLISHEFSWYKGDYREFAFNLDRRRLAGEGIAPSDLYASLRPVFGRDIPSGSIVTGSDAERLKLSSRQSSEYDVWSLLHAPQPSTAGHAPYIISSLAAVDMQLMPQNVAKVNQQYRLCLQYEYIGAFSQGNKVEQQTVDIFNGLMPMGYSAETEDPYSYWGDKEGSQYLLLLLIIVIIYFTSGILFNSLRQPLAIIFVIPISYMGVFLTFFLFGLNFDQGGFASFIILCGITINASIYILNEYNKVRERRPLLSPRRAYLKAWNIKIGPIFLTIISSVLGFLPFMIGAEREAFWFPLAAGTIGGLIMSIVGIFLYLPLFTIPNR
jgi:multidrug efflux pump subunit AcrB